MSDDYDEFQDLGIEETDLNISEDSDEEVIGDMNILDGDFSDIENITSSFAMGTDDFIDISEDLQDISFDEDEDIEFQDISEEPQTFVEENVIYENVDYSARLLDISNLISKDIKSFNSKAPVNKARYIKQDLGLNNASYPYLTEPIFYAYQERWVEMVSNENSFLPLDEFISLCKMTFKEMGYTLGLNTSAFEDSAKADYIRIKNNMLLLQSDKSNSSKDILTPDETLCVKETEAILSGITELSYLVNKLSAADDFQGVTYGNNISSNIRLICMQVKDYLLGYVLGNFRATQSAKAPEETCMMVSVNDVLNYLTALIGGDQYDDNSNIAIVRSNFKVDTDSISAGEKFRYLLKYLYTQEGHKYVVKTKSEFYNKNMISEVIKDAVKAYSDTENITASILVTLLILAAYIQPDNDMTSYSHLMRSMGYSTGELNSWENEHNIMLQSRIIVAFNKYMDVLENHTECSNISILQSARQDEQGNVYARCLKGGETKIDTERLFMLVKTNNKTLFMPLIHKCSCADRNCTGCCILEPAFVRIISDSVIDSVNNGTKMVFRVKLTPLFLKNLLPNFLPEIVTKVEEPKEKIDMYRKDLLDEFCDDFKFKDEEDITQFFKINYTGKLNGVGEILDEREEHSLTAFLSKYGASYVANIIAIDGTEVAESGTWIGEDGDISITFFSEKSITPITVTIPTTNESFKYEQQLDEYSNNVVELKPSVYLSNIAFNYNHDVNNSLKNMILELCYLNSIPYDLLRAEAEAKVAKTLRYVLNIDGLIIGLHQVALESYREWSKDETNVNDLANVDRLKSLIAVISGVDLSDKETLPSMSIVTKLLNETPNKLAEIANYIAGLDLDIIVHSVSQYVPAITKEEEQELHALLAMPNIGPLLEDIMHRLMLVQIIKTGTPVPVSNQSLKRSIDIIVNQITTPDDLNTQNQKNSSVYRAANSVFSKSRNSSTDYFRTYRQLYARYKHTEDILNSVDNRQEVINSLAILKDAIMSNNKFLVLHSLYKLGKQDILKGVLKSLPEEIDLDVLTNTSNEEEFNKKYNTCMLINDNLDKLSELLLNAMAFDFITDMSIKDYIKYTIMIGVHEIYGFNVNSGDIEDTLTEDYKNDFFTVLGSIYLTYGYITQDAAVDSYSRVDRGIIRASNPDCIKEISDPYFSTLDLVDYLADGLSN